MINMHKLMKKNKYNGKKVKEILEIDGLKVSPKTNFADAEISVKSLVLINQTFIEKVLKRKIKHKLNSYINYIISLLNDDEDDPNRLNIALNDIAHYKSIIEYKYRKYLEEKYVSLLLKKIEVVEYELKRKIICYNETYDYEDKEIRGKSR